MKQVLPLFLAIIHFSIAQQPPIMQTVISPQTELLRARAQMSPQTQPHTESYEQEIARLTSQNQIQDNEIKKLLLLIQSLEAELNKTKNLHLEKGTEVERLKESLRNITHISVKQKADIEEKDDLLERATKEIVALQQQQEDHQAKLRQVISNGYKKLEQMKQEQVARGVFP